MSHTPITPAYFTKDPRVETYIAQLKEQCGERCEKKHISDIYDEEGHPYVNLVQEGGGILGIALVGYTYALESVGIRFLKLAGTSAGAINTVLLATVIPTEAYPTKSEKILSHLAPKDFFSFVDAHWFPKFCIKIFITNKNITRILKYVGIAFVAMLCLGPLLALFRYKWASIFIGLSAGSWILLALMALFGLYLWRKFKKNGWGIANGNEFRNWISEILREEIKGSKEAPDVTIQDFENHIRQNAVQDLWLSAAYMQEAQLTEEQTKDWGRNYIQDLINPSFSTNPGWVTFIASDITTQNKIELPRMWPLYRADATQNELYIADFVRASMSIPIFFRIHKITGIPARNNYSSRETFEEKRIRECWENKDYLNYPPNRRIPTEVSMVDGGVLSNFPINIFFNPKVTKPRLPTLGVRLGEDNELNQRFRSVGKYLTSLLNTIRYHYDKDFQVKHSEFMKTTSFLKVDQFNWLNFNLSNREKLALFLVGVEAAHEFLLTRDGHPDGIAPGETAGFNFTEVQNARPEVLQKLNAS